MAIDIQFSLYIHSTLRANLIKYWIPSTGPSQGDRALLLWVGGNPTKWGMPEKNKKTFYPTVF